MPLDICNKCKNATATNTSAASSPSGGSSSSPGDKGTTKRPPKVSAENAKMIAELNSLDMELYEFAKALFRLKVGACLADEK